MRAGLTEAGRTFSGLDWRRFGSNLVVVELATAVVLFVSAGLFARSFYRLLQVDSGFQPHNLAIVFLSAPREHYPQAPQRVALVRQIMDRVSALPGVSSVAITGKLPIVDGDGTSSIAILGHEHPGEHNEVAWRPVSTGYFKTLGARLLAGRYFTDAGAEPNHPHVAIINRALAQNYFVGLNPVGMRIN